MKIVLDCNVFIGAAITKNVCWKTFHEVIGWHESFLSDEIVEEYEMTIQKPKFKKHIHKLREYLEIWKKLSIRVEPVKVGIHLKDHKDVKYLAVAFSAKADILITGDLAHFPEPFYGTVRILRPHEFLSLCGK